MGRIGGQSLSRSIDWAGPLKFKGAGSVWVEWSIGLGAGSVWVVKVEWSIGPGQGQRVGKGSGQVCTQDLQGIGAGLSPG